MEVDVIKKTSSRILGTIRKAEDVFNLKEVQEIKDAMREHLLFLSLDQQNNLRSINLLGIGTNSEVQISSKDIVRTALMSGNNNVILVHNHPSDSLRPSNQDLHLSNVTNKFLEIFGIKMLDHIIVTSDNYMSMESMKQINREFADDKIEYLDKAILFEENQRLKGEKEVEFNTEEMVEDDEMEF